MAKEKLDINQSFIRDKNGNVVIWQWPNVALWGWIVLKVLSLLFNKGQTHIGFEKLSTAFLFSWAFLEITSGVTYFRRVIGLLVLIVVVTGFYTT